MDHLCQEVTPVKSVSKVSVPLHNLILSTLLTLYQEVSAVTMALNFVTIDFEAANSNRASACAIGLVKVQDGKVTDRDYSLIKPHESVNYFNEYNCRVHGITPEDVADAPLWSDIYDRVIEFIDGMPVAAHNADYDLDVLKAVSERYGLECPDIDYFCTHWLAKKSIPGQSSYKLTTISESLGIDLSGLTAHNAGDDALMAALVCLESAAAIGADSVEEAMIACGGRVVPLSRKSRKNLPVFP